MMINLDSTYCLHRARFDYSRRKLRQPAIIGGLCVLAIALFSAAASAESASLGMSSTVAEVDIGRWIGALIMVLLLVCLSAWALKKIQSMGGIGGGYLKVISAVSLGGRERAVLLKVDRRYVLVGVAVGSVRTLVVFEPGELLECDSSSRESGVFAGQLSGLLQGVQK